MSSSNSKRQRSRKAKKAELAQRKFKASRRRRGLAPGQEEAELASYLRRFVAFLIDQVIYVFFFMFFMIILSIVSGQGLASAVGSISSIFIFGFIYFVPGLKRFGQTYGCKKAKIVVLDHSGDEYLNTKNSFIRWFMSLGIPATASSLALVLLPKSFNILVSTFLYLALLGINFIPILRTPNRQGVHDLFARSIVIKELQLKTAPKKTR